jgi:nucleotidyltransferase/DNA polymerase involved in DNA repair
MVATLEVSSKTDAQSSSNFPHTYSTISKNHCLSTFHVRSFPDAIFLPYSLPEQTRSHTLKGPIKTTTEFVELTVQLLETNYREYEDVRVVWQKFTDVSEVLAG